MRNNRGFAHIVFLAAVVSLLVSATGLAIVHRNYPHAFSPMVPTTNSVAQPTTIQSQSGCPAVMAPPCTNDRLPPGCGYSAMPNPLNCPAGCPIICGMQQLSSPAPTSTISQAQTNPTTTISGPYVGTGQVGQSNSNLQTVPTSPPFDINSMRCTTNSDCYDSQGNPKGMCEVPCQNTAVCQSGYCVKPGIPGYLCLSIHTQIDTPRGQIPVEQVTVGMSVWTMNQTGERIVAPILKIAKTPVPNTHQVVNLVLADGRAVHVSPSHPTADGTLVSYLRLGDTLDGSPITALTYIPYTHNYTYDILPQGPTGVFFANGILMGSTLTIPQ